MNLLIYGVYDDNNLGDDYMMQKIHKYLKEQGTNVSFVERNIKKNNYFINEEIDYLENPIIYKKSGKLKKIKKLLSIIKWFICNDDIEKFDALIFMGGGYTNEQFGISNLFKLLLWKYKFKKVNKKIFFTGQTIGPASTKISSFLLKKLYKGSTLVNVREKNSLMYIENNDIVGNIVGDDAFLDKRREISYKQKENILIVNYKCFNDYSDENLFMNAVKEFAQKNNLKVFVIPFRSDNNYEEYKINYNIYQELKQKNIDASFVVERNIEKLEDIFLKSKYVIGSAYHAIVLGLKYGNSVVSIYKGNYYKIKMNGILDWYNLNENAIQFCDIDVNLIEKCLKEKYNFETIYSNTNELIENLNNGWNNIIKIIKEK